MVLPGETDQLTGGALRSALSQAVTRIHADHYGKGATQTKTHLLDGLVVVVLRDVLTVVERTLVSGDRADLVGEVRRTFQAQLGPQFVDAVEQLTGRRVESFMSQIDPERDIAVEVFVLAEPCAQRSSGG